MSNEPSVQALIALYAMISRMRVLSMPRTVACAEQVMIATIGGIVTVTGSGSEIAHGVGNGRCNGSNRPNRPITSCPLP
jgi:hypothetical protein